jgi:hypothetical protein
MVNRVKRLVRATARRTLKPLRRVLLRVLRPIILRLDTHMQWLFDRQQDDRMRLVVLEQQMRALQQQVGALQRQLSRRSYAA